MTAAKPAERQLVGKAHFSVEARLAIQLGRESISSSIIAILELVKNAYDADASTVRIRFIGLGTDNQAMVIDDDGKGMTVDDVRHYWMVIGTSNKTGSRRTERNRVLTGEKGLGRLGLDRLCRTTTLQSISEGTSQGVELVLDWTKYEQEKALLEDVSHEIYSISGAWRDPITGRTSVHPKGTRYILHGLKDEWDESAVADLRAELSLLVSPFASSNDFRIELSSGMDWKSVDGVVQVPSSLLEAAQWKVTASIDKSGRVRMRMDSAHHNRVYEDGPHTWHKRFPAAGPKPRCGPLRFEFYFFPRRTMTLGDQTISLTTIRTFLDSNQGLRIYRDGFRVKPYGSPNGDGDWLKLAYRRISSPEGVTQDPKPGNWRVGYNQVVGAVFVSREKNGELLDQTNREGLVEGKALTHLRIFAEETIRFFEVNHQDYEMSLGKKRSTREEATEQAGASVRATAKALERLGEVTGTIGTLLKGLSDEGRSLDLKGKVQEVETATSGTLGEIKKTLEQAKEQLEQSAKTIRAEDERDSMEKDTMANLASLGILAAAFGHETLGWASSCAANAGWLDRNLGKKYFFFPTPDEAAEVRQRVQDTVTQAKRLETFAEFSIGNVLPEKRKRTIFCLKTIIVNVFKAFDESLRVQRKINLDVSANLPEEPCYIRGYPIDWESVLVNLITNAVWAIGQKQGERIIRVSLQPADELYRLEFDDSGIGIASGSEERIFLPTYSTKCNNRGEPNGTGMGLTIVKNFVEQNTGASIRAVASGRLGGASFVIHVPAARRGREA